MRTPVWVLSALVLLLTLSSEGKVSSSRSSWSWSCEYDKCVRSDAPSSRAGRGNSSHASVAQCRATCGQYGALWPRPTGDSRLGSALVAFHPSRLSFDLQQVAPGASDFLDAAARRFTQDLSRHGCEDADPGTDVVVRLAVGSPALTLDWDTDEAYNLTVTSQGHLVTVQIGAGTVFGARHGLATLSQLVVGCPLSVLGQAVLSDSPAYAHRGLSLDTSRNFLSIGSLKRMVDAMADCKLNVLHWHATDSHSFPLAIPRVPQLARYGAYSASEVYSAQDVSGLVQYAQQRGVRVLMEIDAPSHAGSGWEWGETEGLGKLAVCVNRQPWRYYCIQPPCGQLNPANDALYNVLRELYKDLLGLLAVDESIHMGGDEVFFHCWNTTNEIVQWMADRGLGRSQEDFLQVWSEFQAKALKILDEERGHSSTPVLLWSSHLTDPSVIEKYLDKNRYIIQTWVMKQDTLPKELLSKGYRLVMATKDTWYLDHGFWGSTKYHNWRVVYENNLPSDKGVLGGEVAMWTELVDDSSLDSRVWPRAAALAERLWADPSTDSVQAEARFFQHRERLVQMGIAAEAVTPRWCYLHEGDCQ